MKIQSVVLVSTLMVLGCGKEEKFTEGAPKDNIHSDLTVEKSPSAQPKSAEPADEAMPASKEAKVAVADSPPPIAEPADEANATPSTEASAEAEAAAADAPPTAADDSPTLGRPALTPREGMHIAALSLARGVEKNEDNKRVAVDKGTIFENDGRRVYAIFDIENPNEEEAELMVGWIPPGSDKERNRVSLTVKPKKTWRTWAFNKFATKAGVWQVVVRDAEDTVLARAAFEMKAE